MSEIVEKKEKSMTIKQKLWLILLFGVLLVPSLLMFSPVSNELTMNEEEHQVQQVMSLLEPLETIEVHSVNIGYETVVIASTSMLSGPVEQEITSGVVVVYSGTLTNAYDVMEAISILLNVPFYQIKFVEV